MQYLILLIFSSVLFISGCKSIPTDTASQFSSSEKKAIREARKLIVSGRAECILIQNNQIAIVESGHGVSPLLSLYEKHKEEMADGIIVDKVIGRAAAAIAICGRVRHVHGEVMSEDAVVFLNDNGVTASNMMLVPRILNKQRDALCPLEKSVEGIVNPDQALDALKKKIESFKKKPQK